MQYTKFMFYYPPRPEGKISPDQLTKYDTGEYMAQPKYNGSCAALAMNENPASMQLFNRHAEKLTLVKHDLIDFAAAYRGQENNSWLYLCGELLNKNQRGENGQPFNQKFIIWDILVFKSQYLTGTSFEWRQQLLEELYPCNRMQITANGLEQYDHLCCTGHTGIYRAPNYTHGFADLYTDITKTELYEGLVLKRRTAKLEYGFNEKNNTGWQIKCRKETKNYHF